jgi:hypothetical protein
MQEDMEAAMNKGRKKKLEEEIEEEKLNLWLDMEALSALTMAQEEAAAKVQEEGKKKRKKEAEGFYEKEEAVQAGLVAMTINEVTITIQASQTSEQLGARMATLSNHQPISFTGARITSHLQSISFTGARMVAKAKRWDLWRWLLTR